MSTDGETVESTPGVSLASLEGLDDLPVHDHVARFEAVHEALVARLEGPQGTPAGGTEA